MAPMRPYHAHQASHIDHIQKPQSGSMKVFQTERLHKPKNIWINKFKHLSRTFQEVSINSLLVVKGCPTTTCWKVLVIYNINLVPHLKRNRYEPIKERVSSNSPRILPTLFQASSVMVDVARALAVRILA